VIVQMIPAGLRGALIRSAVGGIHVVVRFEPSMRRVHGVRDMVQPAKPDLSVKALVRSATLRRFRPLSWHCHRNPSRKHQEHLGVDACRRHWRYLIPMSCDGIGGASNGWGYAAGIFGGLGAATLFGIGQTFHWFRALGLAEYVYAPIIWLASLRGFVGVAADARDPDCGIGDVLYARPAFSASGNPFGPHSRWPLRRSASLPMGGHQCRCGVFALIASFSRFFPDRPLFLLLRHRDRRRPAVWHHPLSLLVQVIPPCVRSNDRRGTSLADLEH